MVGYVDVVEVADKSFLLRLAEFSLSPLRIALNGKRYTGAGLQADKKIYSIAHRIFAAIAAVVLFPLTLLGWAVKWWKREEWQFHSILIVNPMKDDEISQDPQLACDLSQKEFNQSLKEELAQAAHLDIKLAPPTQGSWRKYGESHGERNQICDHYFTDDKEVWPDKEPLVIQRLGAFDQFDSKIIAITADFLRVFHQKPVHIRDGILTMDELKTRDDLFWESKMQEAKDSGDEKEVASISSWKDWEQKQLVEAFPRKNGQYDGIRALDLIQRNLTSSIEESFKERCDVIALTTEDLYAPPLSNFVFGVASLRNRTGIWSKARFGDPKKSIRDFESCLIRMMKISAHEFGHMRGISHCTDYECNIGGYMSLPELDQRPLTYCLQDTAKICSLARLSLREYHQRLLRFFQRFNQRYGLNCDFSNEIHTLKGRIGAL